MKKFPFFVLALLMMLLADFYLIFSYSPEEAGQGIVQKIFYFHVSSAFAMYAGFLMAGLFAFLYLWKKKPGFNSLSESAASIGLLFCTMVLASGPVWAKPIWGTYWTWTPRLITTLILWLIFAGVFFLRKFFEGEEKGKTFASVLTLLGVLDIPLVYYAVKLWRDIHPAVLGGENNMPFEMKFTLIFTNVTVLFLFGVLFYLRTKVGRLEESAQLSA